MGFWSTLFHRGVTRKDVFVAWHRFYSRWTGSLPITDFSIKQELPVVEHSCDKSVMLDICSRQFKYYYLGKLIATTKELSYTELYGMLASHDEKYFATMLEAAISSIEDYLED